MTHTFVEHEITMTRKRNLETMAVKEIEDATPNVESLIFEIRNQRVILDSDLAQIYGETTARLNQQVRRNADRFPPDFAFELTKEEFARLMLQIATSKKGRK